MSDWIKEFQDWAMKVTDQEEADRGLVLFVDKCVKKTDKTHAEIDKIQRSNLAYYAGYFNAKTRRRVEKLFRCKHPVFGSIEENGEPTPEKAFLMGQIMGAEIKAKHELSEMQKRN